MSIFEWRVFSPWQAAELITILEEERQYKLLEHFLEEALVFLDGPPCEAVEELERVMEAALDRLQ